MSGLAAILRRDGAPASEPLLRRMLTRLAHRGPDGTKLRMLGSAGLAHALLATTEEDAGRTQPIASEDGAIVLVADARIDNRADLLAAGAAEGRRHAEVCDAELILWAYERWGEACASRLVGDFAFVLWDARRRLLFGARDHLGVRPLFYRASAESFACASEMQVLFADRAVRRVPHRLSLGLFLAGEYTERDQTLYEGIFALPPGHTLVVDQRSVCVSEYWRPDPTRRIRFAREAEYGPALRAVLDEAVRCRMRARERLAMELSGGLDSSSVVGVAERLRRGGRVHAEAPLLLTFRYPGLPLDETPFSDAVAAHWGLPLDVMRPLDTSAARHRPDPALQVPDVYYDVGVLDTIPELELLSKHGVRVVLTGMGSDQLMRRTGHEVDGYVRRLEARHALEAVGLAEKPRSPRRWRALARACARSVAPTRVRQLVRRARLVRGRRCPWIAEPLARDVEARVAERRGRAQAAPYPDDVARNLVEELGAGPDVLLALGRLGSLAARRGMEFRHPFFDVRLVEHLLALPDHQRTGTTLPKPALRAALGADLPDLVSRRCTASEASCYYERVLLGHHERAVRDLLAGSRLVEEGIADRSEIVRMLEHAADHVLPLTTVISLELWLRQIDQEHNDDEDTHGEQDARARAVP